MNKIYPLILQTLIGAALLVVGLLLFTNTPTLVTLDPKVLFTLLLWMVGVLYIKDGLINLISMAEGVVIVALKGENDECKEDKEEKKHG